MAARPAAARQAAARRAAAVGSPQPKQERSTYEVDVDFGPRGSTRSFDGVATLDPLTERNPRLLFLGVADDAKRAAFSVLDPEVRERGDGKCLDFGDRCAVLYLKVGEKHSFTERDDDRYELRLRAIDEVRLDG